MTYWILIADASRARVFSTTGPDAPLHPERELENPEGRARTQDLVTDEPGRLRIGASPGTRSAMDPPTTAHEAAKEGFVIHLAKMLKEEAHRQKFDSLALVAPPHLLGQLRSRLPKHVRALLRASLAKDLVRVDRAELRPHLTSLFVPGVFAEK